MSDYLTPVLTTAEVSKALKISRAQVYRLLHSGKIAGTQKYGHWRIPAVVLEAELLESCMMIRKSLQASSHKNI